MPRTVPYNATYHSCICQNFRREFLTKYSVEHCFLTDKEIWDIWRKIEVFETPDIDEEECLQQMKKLHDQKAK